jgi:hypothetical protein
LAFKEFKAKVDNYLGGKLTKLSVMRVDNAPEYTEGPLRSFLAENGIEYEKTVPDASQQNGVAERHNGIVEAISRALLVDANLSDWFWPLAAQTAVHIVNRSPHSALDGNTPFYALHQKKPDVSHFRIFGSKVVARKTESDSLSKMEPRGEDGRFMGYSRDSRGYLIWFPHKNKLMVRRDVKFIDSPPSHHQTPIIERSQMWEDILNPDTKPSFVYGKDRMFYSPHEPVTLHVPTPKAIMSPTPRSPPEKRSGTAEGVY